MGVYIISVDEFQEKFKEFLMGFQGDISALVVAESWNNLAEEYGWLDRLEDYEKASKN